MKISSLVIVLLALLGVGQAKAQIITGFGSGALNPVNLSTDFIAPWTSAVASQAPNSLTVTAEPAAGGGELYSTLTTPVALGDTNPTTLKLLLTGMVTEPTPANFFTVTLYDTSGSFNSLAFTYSWGSWTALDTTETVAAGNPTELGAFNGTVGSYAIQAGGGPSDTISFQFDSLDAVPEPSTYAMLGVGLLALVIWQRRNKARLS